MSWVTIIWSAAASSCLTMALVHAMIWWRRRKAAANALFGTLALATSLNAICELWVMRARTVGEIGSAERWMYVLLSVMIVVLAGFVRVYLRAGRRWLFWAIAGTRTVALVLNFVFDPNLFYREITGLRHIHFLGETVTIPEGVPNPWMLVGQLSTLLLGVFVIDAMITIWRRDAQRSARLLSASITFLVLGAAAMGIPTLWGMSDLPIMSSLFFIGVVVAMSVELSWDAIRASDLSRELTESEARMSLAAEAAGFGVWIWNMKRNQVWGSDRWLALFGFAPGETVGNDQVSRRLHPEDREAVDREVKRVLGTGEDYVAEFRIILPDGTVRWIGARGRVCPDEHGNSDRMLGAAIDVTERRRADAALIESEAKLRGVFECSRDAIGIALKGVHMFANPAYLKLFGFANNAQIVGTSILESIALSHRPMMLRKIERRTAGENAPTFYESRGITTDGHEFDMDISVSTFQLHGEIYSIASIRDITERKQAEEALRSHTALLEVETTERKEAESRLALVINSTDDLIWSVDSATLGLTMFNEALRRNMELRHGVRIRLGMLPEEILPRDLAVRWREFYKHALARGELSIDYRLDDLGRDYQITFHTIKREGVVVGYSVFAKDITETKEAEKRLQFSREQLRALSARLQKLREEERIHLAREIHDHLGQLLTALGLDLRYIERRAASIIDAELGAALKSKVVSTRLLASEIVTSIQKIAAELRPALLDRVGLEAAIENEGEAFQSRSGVACELNLPPKRMTLTPEETTAVFRIFQETLTNIARHAGASHVSVRLCQENGHLLLAVADDGVGIKDTDLERPQSLGLLGMQERAEMLGGQIQFTRNPTRGTTVTLRLPLKHETQPA